MILLSSLANRPAFACAVPPSAPADISTSDNNSADGCDANNVTNRIWDLKYQYLGTNHTVLSGYEIFGACQISYYDCASNFIAAISREGTRDFYNPDQGGSYLVYWDARQYYTWSLPCDHSTAVVYGFDYDQYYVGTTTVTC